MEIHLALYDNDSLKAKRSALKRILHRTRAQFNVSAAEVEDHDFRNRGILGFVSVGPDKVYLEGLLQKVEAFIDKIGLADIVEARRTFEYF